MGIPRNLLITVGIICVGLIVRFAVAEGTKSAFTTSDVQGLHITLETFNAGCAPAATQDGTLTQDQGTNYCTCVFNEGNSRFGQDEFMKMTANLGNTKSFTPEYNDLVNHCVATVLQ